MTGAPDLVVLGHVVTLDPQRPEAEAVAVREGVIVAVGSRAEIEALADGTTRVLDVGGAFVLPGFVDAHSHPLDHGLALLRLDLSGAPSLEAALEAVKERARLTPEGGWVRGGGWDESTWGGDPTPTRTALDLASPQHPVLLERVDRHVGVANTAALMALDLDPEVHADGLLREQVLYDALARLTPAPATRRLALKRLLRDAREKGVTCLHGIVTLEDVALLRDAEERGELTARFRCYLRHEALPDLEAGTVDRTSEDPWVRIQGVKLFADGSLGARTAFLSSDYADEPGTRGELVHGSAELAALVRRIHAAGLQVATHAIGDAAAAAVLDAYAAAGLGPADRPRIEHLELLDDEDLPRLLALGVVASCQPNFVGNWGHPGGLYEARLGADALGRDNRYRVLLDAGVPLAFGSDDMPFGPLAGLHGARTAPGDAQRLDAESALRAYTLGGAFGAFEEGTMGVLREGALGDLVVLDGDPRDEAVDPRSLQVLVTIAGGRVVREARG